MNQNDEFVLINVYNGAKKNLLHGGCRNLRYNEILNEYIEKSRLSHREISRRCKELGKSVSQAYISQVVKGDVPPPSEEVNKVLAQVLNGDPDKLIWYSYIEKAPEEMKEILYIIGDEMVGAAKKFLNKYPGFFEGKYREEEYNNSKEFRDFSIALMELTMEKVPRPSFRLNKDSKYSSIIDFDNYKDNRLTRLEDLENVTNIINVPVLGYIAAGAPILAQEHIIEEMNIPNPGTFKEGELFLLIVKGDSMTGSRIQEGDRVLVKIQPEVENGEIAVVNVDGENATLKKVKRYDDGSWWLISTNEKYAPIPLTSERARIIGKVIQVIFEP